MAPFEASVHSTFTCADETATADKFVGFGNRGPAQAAEVIPPAHNAITHVKPSADTGRPLCFPTTTINSLLHAQGWPPFRTTSAQDSHVGYQDKASDTHGKHNLWSAQAGTRYMVSDLGTGRTVDEGILRHLVDIKRSEFILMPSKAELHHIGFWFYSTHIFFIYIFGVVYLCTTLGKMTNFRFNLMEVESVSLAQARIEHVTTVDDFVAIDAPHRSFSRGPGHAKDQGLTRPPNRLVASLAYSKRASRVSFNTHLVRFGAPGCLISTYFC